VLLSPAPGVRLNELRAKLTSIRNEASNVRSGDRLATYTNYIRWANESVRQLRGQLSPADIDRLVLTRRHSHLIGLSDASHTHALSLVHTELDERMTDLDQVLQDLEQEASRWSRDGVYVVADTTRFIEHPEKIDSWDLAEMLDLGFQTTHLIVPIVVIDELDNLKKKGNSPHTPWRARHTLQVLDSVLPNPEEAGTLRQPTLTPFGGTGAFAPRGEVTVEIVFDPPNHVRLPINDDEIIDRTVAIQTIIGRPIHFLTYDTGQSMRARVAGLRVTKLAMPPEGDEPDRRQSKSANSKGGAQRSAGQRGADPR
jgi:hypothetical protein